MERRKQYDKKYKLPGKQGIKGNIINSAACIVEVDTSVAVEKKIFPCSHALWRREKTHMEQQLTTQSYT